MDFYRMLNTDIEEFLVINGKELTDPVENIANAINLFGGANVLTDAVNDLILASEYVGPKTWKYTLNSLIAATPLYISLFADVLRIKFEDDAINKFRVIRVLGYIGLIQNPIQLALYQAFLYSARTLTWRIVDLDSAPNIDSRLDMYSSINYENVLPTIVGQVIDSNGKTRMFKVKPQIDAEGAISDKTIFVSVPPTQPINVPEFDYKTSARDLPDWKDTVSMFGNPSYVTTNVEKTQATGLWFSINDDPRAVYCQFSHVGLTEITAHYPDIVINQENDVLVLKIPVNQIANVDRVKKLMNSVLILRQIVRYVYMVYRNQWPAMLTISINDRIKLFMTNNFMYSSDKDSVVIYEYPGLKRILPDEVDSQKLLEKLSKQVNFITKAQQSDNYKIIMYDKHMVNSVVYDLRKFAKVVDSSDLNNDISLYREIDGYYSNRLSFTSDPEREFVITSISDYNQWVNINVPLLDPESRSIQNLSKNIQYKLKESMSSIFEPFVYQLSTNVMQVSSIDPSDDKFYIVQGVVSSKFMRAIAVAYNWATQKKNTGPKTLLWNYSDSLPAHMIYSISEEGSIIESQDNTEDAEDYLHILKYSNKLNYYGALLPLE